jgi:hypothetical protein
VRAITIARALAPRGESGVRVREKADVAGESGVMHWHQPKGMTIDISVPLCSSISPRLPGM